MKQNCILYLTHFHISTMTSFGSKRYDSCWIKLGRKKTLEWDTKRLDLVSCNWSLISDWSPGWRRILRNICAFLGERSGIGFWSLAIFGDSKYLSMRSTYIALSFSFPDNLAFHQFLVEMQHVETGKKRGVSRFRTV